MQKRMGDEKEIMDEENGGCSCFAVKIPRLDYEVGKEQIRVAELHLDDKTSCREAIRLQIQTRIENDEYKYAADQLKSARDLVRLKRKEIDSHLSVLRLVKNTFSFHDNFQQQLEAQLHLKTLKKELESLKASVVEAESAAAEASLRKNHDQEAKQLEARLRDANDACQAAYAHLRYLRTQHRDKMRHFLGYRNEATAATKYAARSRVKCDRLCKNQVERFMIMWNKNSMFRQDYVNSNATSTVRRFGTLDGRSLGPDEQPHMLPRHVDVPVVIPEENEQGISGNDVSNEAELKLELVEADKPQIGPELKAQMEAEKREKKKHKRLRLKERKKAAATGDHHHQMEEKIQQVSEKGSSEASPPSDNLLLQQEEPEKDVEVTTQAEETRRTLQQQGDVVEVTMHAEETKGEEGEDGLKEGVQQLQGQTGGDQRQQVTNEKRRQKRLRKKERNKAAREGRSGVDRTETPELTDHHHEQTYVGSNPEMQSNADDEKRDQNQQVMSQETPEPGNYATLTPDHDPNEEQQEEATVHDPKEDEEEQQEQEEEVTIHDPKEEEEEQQQQQQEEATIHDPKEEEEVTIHDPREEEEEEEEEQQEEEELQQHEQEEEVTIHDPKEEEEEEEQQQHEQEEEVTIHDPKEEEEEEEEEEEVTIHDPKEEEDEEEEEQQQQEEVTMQVEDTEVIEQLREALMAQMRAEIKAQLEAEIRDKKREKRLRKKGRNKERKEAATNGKAFIWMAIFIIVTLILCLTHFRFNLTTIPRS